MVRHTDDNDKKPRPRQDAGARKPAARGPRPDKGPGGEIRGKRYSADPAAQKGKGGKDAKAPAEPKRTERIAKALARAGIASRREVERLIGLGKVAVNGRILDTPATLVTRDDKITVDGKAIGAAEATRVWRYNKPVGLLTSHNDPAGRPTVFDNLPSGLPRVISVGRLDINTEGLLLLTNDGELSRALELPSTALVRQYRARARGRVTQAQLDRLKDGVTVDGVEYGPIEATLDKVKDSAADDGRGPANLWISVSITEGKNREVRKVLESVGLTVNRLIRLAYGPFQLGELPSGAVEEVGPRVIRELLAEHIRPENLPQGNTVQTPAPIPGRRSGPVVRGKSGSAMSDPSRKPSRIRAAETAIEEAEKRPEKKAGWAKAKPKFEHTKTFKPRARPEGEAGAADTRGDRPRRSPRSIEDKLIGAKSETWARDAKDRKGPGGDRKFGGKPGGDRKFGGDRKGPGGPRGAKGPGAKGPGGRSGPPRGRG
jgi:23S rRNA pseudouridine2605 synthase